MPALASRPGRIDQTIEFPLPDKAHRRRLVSLHAKRLPLQTSHSDELAERTEGASPAFIKELMRRIARHHPEAGESGGVRRSTAESALHEMPFSGGTLNARLLAGAVQARCRRRPEARHCRASTAVPYADFNGPPRAKSASSAR